MRKALFCLLFLLCVAAGYGKHIKGGFFTYEYLGKGIIDPTKLNYKITLNVYMDCAAIDGQVDPYINFTIFTGSSSVVYANVTVTKSADYFLQKTYIDPCITGYQPACYYRIILYELGSYELPEAPDGYTISYQRCCRLNNMDNIVNSGAVGTTYTIKIPGTLFPIPNANTNSSPTLPINDTILICENSYFKYSFQATDKDGDSLAYHFCNSLDGGDNNLNIAPSIATAPNYTSVPYLYPFSGSAQLGPGVTINATTGLMSGVAPTINNTGEYAVMVCISEFRNGLYLGKTTKELHIRVKDCTFASAKLSPVPTSCDGFGLKFSNNAANPSGIDYAWTFGDNQSASNTSTSPNPFHAYTDTGIFLLTLRVSIGGSCADSTTTFIKVYPGFFPGFKTLYPLCKGAPVQFVDTTTSNYGVPTGWKWNFGNNNVTSDISNTQHPNYTYSDSGTYQVQFIVSNTFGCTDTLTKNIQIKNSPVINLITRDTLICLQQKLQLTSNNTGTFVWSPNYHMDNLSSNQPLVNPLVPTTYFVIFTDALGCSNTDSVFVNVMTKIEINPGADTTICRTDGVLISTISNAATFKWAPATYLNNSNLKSPLATPLDKLITYQVVGNLGKCKDSASINISTLPYPIAYPKKDTTICFGSSLNLLVSGGNSYLWQPALFLSATNIPNPTVIMPTVSTQYIVTVKGSPELGTCYKATFDTFFVQVDPLLTANAGANETTVVLGEPLFLFGSGRGTYLWTPATWLNLATMANPIANPEDNITYHLLVTSAAGCQARDSIHIKLYKVPPSFYVPTAFSPNNDNSNDILKPILLGMKTLDFFRVYNRAGQLLYTTSQKGAGWDGYYNGNPQDPATYIWMAQGTMFTGEKIVRKGFAVLLR